MHVEIQVALNFVISFLYNKLPRRRVNQFGEELEKALKLKFEGHWYPEKPFKGSAFRCLKTAPPLDPVFEVAARESGMDLSDIQENLPQELSVWIDPGEVSYRMSEKGPVKVLYSESESSEENADREITRTFNPEAQCFKPIDSVASQLGSLSVSGSASTSPYGNNSAPSPTYKSTSPVNAFIPKSTTPLTFTTATFAQTKFGSTKLKTSSKRSHRMSPTEFSNYIKQRAMLQQQAQQAVAAQQQLAATAQSHSAQSVAAAAMFAAAAATASSAGAGSSPSQHSRSLSPSPAQQLDPSFLLMASSPQPPQFAAQNHFSPPTSRSAFGSPASTATMFENANGYLQDIFAAGAAASTLTATATSKAAAAATQQQRQQQAATNATNASRFSAFFDTKSLVNSAATAGNTFGGLNFNLNDTNSKSFGFDGVNFNLNAMPYPNQYQHLLVAN